MTDLLHRLQETLGSDYAVERELGGGGMSHVFVARDHRLDRQVAIKVFSEDLAEALSLDRFRQEILLVAGLQHPNIVGVISAGDLDGAPYFIMPFVQGESLSHRLRSGPVPAREAVRILKDVSRALQYAHDRDIVHRDVKPANILLTAGAATLADFGVAKALSREETGGAEDGFTRVGTSLGTPAYMAPEQGVGDRATDHRADLYALGAVAYEMLAGKPPFHHKAASALVAAHLTEPPPPLDTLAPTTPGPLADLIHRCLAKDPEERPGSAEEILDALEDPAMMEGARPSRSVFRWGIAAGIAIAAFAAGSLLWSGTASRSAGSIDDARSVAVLPFVNVGGDESDQYFADGMADELTSQLNRVLGLRVASRTAAFAFRETTASVQEIGDRLNVATLLEGTVRRAGDRLRLTANLVQLPAGLSIWSETYERELNDVFAVQDELSATIVGVLREHFGGDIESGDRRSTTADLEAYDLYLRGRYQFEQRGEDGIREAIRLFTAALARDSGFARAHSGLADALIALPLYSTTPTDSVRPLALGAATRAIALDSTLAEALASRGTILTADWRWAEAEQDFRRALLLAPNYAPAYQWYGELLMVTNRVDEAVTRFREGAARDPASPIVASLLGVALSLAGDPAAALAQAEAAIALNPSMPVPRLMMGTILLYHGDFTAATEMLETTASLVPGLPVVQGALGYALGASGRADRARSILAQLDTANATGGAASAAAKIFIGLNRPADAVRWLQRAAALHDPIFASETLASPVFEPLRRRPDFQDLLTRVGLSEYLVEP